MCVFPSIEKECYVWIFIIPSKTALGGENGFFFLQVGFIDMSKLYQNSLQCIIDGTKQKWFN